MLMKTQGQSTLEYAILMVIIIAALLTMQTYVKRSIQGRLKSATDDIGEQYSQEENAGYYKRVKTSSTTQETAKAGRTATYQCALGWTNTITRINTNTVDKHWHGQATAVAVINQGIVNQN